MSLKSNNTNSLNVAFLKENDEALRAILLTVDGKGRAVKEEALKELLDRAWKEGHGCGANSITPLT